jgi:heat shock protein HslJ
VVPGPLGAEIERAYAEAAGAPGRPVLASLTGRFEIKPPEPGAPPREHLVLETLERFHPEQTCARDALAAAPLIDTYWKAVEIEGQPVRLATDQREPHLLLAEKDSRAAGSTGCNRFTGSFRQEGGGLSFPHPLALTRMACPPPADTLERSFLAALEATAAHQIAGETLELRDAEGRVRILFESRHLR